MPESKHITWRDSKGKFVLCKNNIYLPLTLQELDELRSVLEDIKKGSKEFYVKDTKND